MKTYIFDPIHDIPLEEAQSLGEVVKWDEEEIKDYVDAEAVIVRVTKIDKQKIDKMPKLKIIAKHGIGTDNIDLNYAKDRGIVVTNTPTANMTSVAELAVTLALCCARNIVKSNNMTKRGIDSLAPKELTGMEINSKIVGLIGAGRIGQKIGKIFKNGFNLEVCCFDPYITEEEANKIGFKKFENLSEMLKKVDIVSISVPLTDSTKNLIGEKEFDIMKKSSILVNTARGKIVNEKALYNALINNKIKSAAMDVFEEEPPKTDNPLLTLDNFVATPHIGAATEEALINMGITAVEEINLFKNNQTPRYIVNK